jgi:hypothetical protein
MLSPVKQYSFSFISDGLSTSLELDCSLTPIKEVFIGALPTAVLGPVVQSISTGVIPNVTAALAGQKVTFTFPAAPAQNDGNGNLIVYTGTFYLQYSE